MAEEAVFTVLEKGASIVVDEAKYLLDVSEKVESAKNQLRRIQAFLKDVDDWILRGGGSDMARNLVSEVREVAYEVEDIIDAANIMTRQSDPKTTITGAIYKYACFPIYLIHLHKLGERIDVTNIRLKIIFEDFEKFKIPDAAIAKKSRGCMIEDETVKHWRDVHPDFGKQVDVIGFDYQTEQIKGDLLDKRNMHLTVVSIVGPGGAGKSTIAKKVYNLAAVRRNFKVRTWVIVPQKPVPSDLLKEVVKRLVPRDLLNDRIKRTMEVVWVKKGIKLEDIAEQEVKLEEMTMQEVTILLYNFALNERYLIVLDDMWNTDAWDIITAAFPDKKNGSRVILTTRNEVVARHPNAMKKIYVPKLLNEKESTRLLLRTALPEYTMDGSSNSPGVMRQNLCELKKLGKDLAAKCCGLPLAIVVLGGHLSRNLDVDEWKRLSNSMDWHALITTDTIIGAILNLSYYDMPSYLRSCFLYTTAFPKDSHIDVPVLAMLWVAEGFIPQERGRTRENLAISYVAELVQRCMIQVEKRSSSGRIKVIKVHDILRNWGIGLARREGLVKDCHDANDIKTTYSQEMMKAYRMVLHGSLVSEVGTSMRKVRTLLDFTLCFENPRVQVAKSFQGLRVLYLHCSGRILLPRDIGRMRYLRYLGLGGNCMYFLPSTIGDLLSLETLYATASIDHIPGMLWEIPTLRQVHVLHARNLLVPHINPQSKIHAMVLSKSGEWNGLSKSDEMDVDEWDGPSKRIMEATKCRVLKNNNPDLSCCFGMTYSMNDMDIMGRCKEGLHLPNEIPDFEEMHDTTLLKICCANLLSNEKKMLELGMMRLLRVLEIGDHSYTGSLITCPSGSFRCLEQLVLHDLPIEDWKIELGSLACLRKLVLCKCPNLSHLPEGLLRLPHLKKLELIAMHTSCNKQDTVPQKLEKKGCVVFISFNEKDFQHLDLPISASKST